MIRIVKRFLLHYQKDSENSLTREFEELKQDIQMIRYEMLNDIKKSREEIINTTYLLHSGISLVGAELFLNSSSSDLLGLFRQFKTIGSDIRENMIDESSASSSSNGRLFSQARSIMSLQSFAEYIVSQRTEKQLSDETQLERIAETPSTPTRRSSKDLLLDETTAAAMSSQRAAVLDRLNSIVETNEDHIGMNVRITSLIQEDERNRMSIDSAADSEKMAGAEEAETPDLKSNEYPLLAMRKLSKMDP